jgi:uncharacterized membrane protein YhaH (DUF805 family)
LGKMKFIIDGYKELLRYGSLSSRTTKVQLLGALVALLPLVLIVAVAGSALRSSQTNEGLTAAALLAATALILSGPFFIAVIVRRINDTFPGSSWARFFSRHLENTALNILKFVGLWVGLIIIGISMLLFFWPAYLIMLLAVLVLPGTRPTQQSTFIPPPPPSLRSGSLPPLPPQIVATSIQEFVEDERTPLHRQGIFWFAVAAAAFVIVSTLNPGILSSGTNLVEAPSPASSMETSIEPSPIASATPTASPTASPTPTQSLVPVSTTGPEQVVEQPVEAALDPRFRTCGDANAAGYGDYISGVDPEYDWYMDRDRDGIVCER